jgi:hypothetical protein
LELIRRIAGDSISALEIDRSIRSVYIEPTDSPWNEKALIKRKGGHLDVKITVWKDDAFLEGRVFRLFLYICDVLDPPFHYDPRIAPDEEKEPKVTARYNQIWSLYVDSRMERRGIDNFFDRRTRKNLFLDMENQLSWAQSTSLFQKLWTKPSFTYPEIIDFSRNLHALADEPPKMPQEGLPEVEINARIESPHVNEHLKRIPSAPLRDLMNEILSFTAYHCKDCFIESSYYGVSFLYQRKVFVELAPTSDDVLYFTSVNPDSGAYETETITDCFDTETIQAKVKTIYQTLSAHSRNM